MWIFCKDILKTFAVKDNEFDLIHTVVDGWINYDYPNHLLFEHNGKFYIANEINSYNIGFSNVVYIEFSRKQIPLYLIDGSWLYLLNHKNQQWCKISNAKVGGNYYADLPSNKLLPYNVNSISEPITDEIAFNRLGTSLYKSNSLLGEYSWDGDGVKENIIVGKRKYKHTFESNDYTVTESVELIERYTSQWEYTFNGYLYTYSGSLPIGSFTMTSGDKSIPMNYIELTTVVRNDILHYDGGAQIVD